MKKKAVAALAAAALVLAPLSAEAVVLRPLVGTLLGVSRRTADRVRGSGSGGRAGSYRGTKG